MPKIVVGLGNPGPKYETTRHNVGWLALDRLVDRWRAQGPQTKFNAEVFTADVKGERVTLMKPQTFMNNSGQSVGPMFQFLKCKPDDLIVLYDELDLHRASFRLKTGGGAGGHNGIKSIDQHIGAANNAYHRVRIGIGHPRTLNLKIQPVDYVLGQFADEELGPLDALFERIADAVELLVAGDTRKAMNVYNTREPGP
jgi:PTH1 family peptidyl-tRNA hydrolase